MEPNHFTSTPLDAADAFTGRLRDFGCRHFWFGDTWSRTRLTLITDPGPTRPARERWRFDQSYPTSPLCII
ncbi:hypothetical protein M433DRAFT_371122 [Acidomyces richmondensis BFW]|nr:hypothetical protein M433DRAFT_371122 [Acidomyces richmondensis BFW]